MIGWKKKNTRYMFCYHGVWSPPTSYFFFDFIYDIIEEPAHWLYRKWDPKNPEMREKSHNDFRFKICKVKKANGKVSDDKKFPKNLKTNIQVLEHCKICNISR